MGDPPSLATRARMPSFRMCPIRDVSSLGRRPRRPVRLSQRCLGSQYLDPGSALLGQALARQPLPFRRKVGDLRALRLAALAVLGSVLVPGPAVATPALTRVHLLRHDIPLSPWALLSVCAYPGARRRTHLKPPRRAGGRTTVGDRSLLPSARPAEYNRRRSPCRCRPAAPTPLTWRHAPAPR
jgi:hypothetical protein